MKRLGLDDRNRRGNVKDKLTRGFVAVQHLDGNRRLAAILDKMRREQDRPFQVQQRMFAFLDTPTKAVFTAPAGAEFLSISGEAAP